MTGPIKHPFPEPPAEGEAVEVAEGVLWIRLPLPMVLNHVNVYALADGDGWTIVDTGMFSKRTQKIWRDILDGVLGGKPIHRIVVTHHHPDHVGMAAWLMHETSAQLWMTRTAWLMARMLTLDEQDRPTSEAVAFYRGAGMDKAILEKRMTERPFNFCDSVAPLPLGYRRIRQDSRFMIGGRRWWVHVGNGHAPEHATLWCEDAPLVLAGDQIIAGISSNLGVYPTEPDADPVGEWLESCTRLARLAREDHLVLSGHKLPFTGLPLRLTQLIENHHSALARLENHLNEPRTAADCFQPLFMKNIGPGEYGLALVEALGHLNHLYGLGRVSRVRRDDGAWLWSLAEQIEGEDDDRFHE